MFSNKYLGNYSKEMVLSKAVSPRWKAGTLKIRAVDL